MDHCSDPAGTASCNMQIRWEWCWGTWLSPSPFTSTDCKIMKRTACSTVQTEFCRYTELIRLCFQHKWIASLGAVSTVLCTPLHYLKREKREEKRRKFYIYPDVTHTHTHTHTYPAEPGKPWKARGRKKADSRRADGQKQRRGGGEQTDLRNQPTRRNGPDQNSAHT